MEDVEKVSAVVCVNCGQPIFQHRCSVPVSGRYVWMWRWDHASAGSCVDARPVGSAA